MITNRQITALSLQKSGGYRARFSYELSSGKKINIGPIGVIDQAGADVKLLELEPSVLQREQERDALNAATSDTETAVGEASSNQIHLAWLRQAYRSNDHYKAYMKFKNIVKTIFAQGLTDKKYAEQLSITEREFVKIKNYWKFLNTNKAVIIAYGELVRSDR